MDYIQQLNVCINYRIGTALGSPQKTKKSRSLEEMLAKFETKVRALEIYDGALSCARLSCRWVL